MKTAFVFLFVFVVSASSSFVVADSGDDAPTARELLAEQLNEQFLTLYLAVLKAHGHEEIKKLLTRLRGWEKLRQSMKPAISFKELAVFCKAEDLRELRNDLLQEMAMEREVEVNKLSTELTEVHRAVYNTNLSNEGFRALVKTWCRKAKALRPPLDLSKDLGIEAEERDKEMGISLKLERITAWEREHAGIIGNPERRASQEACNELMRAIGASPPTSNVLSP